MSNPEKNIKNREHREKSFLFFHVQTHAATQADCHNFWLNTQTKGKLKNMKQMNVHTLHTTIFLSNITAAAKPYREIERAGERNAERKRERESINLFLFLFASLFLILAQNRCFHKTESTWGPFKWFSHLAKEYERAWNRWHFKLQLWLLET